jgi:heparan-alpha-glucosaminide N-acetyltransferase
MNPPSATLGKADTTLVSPPLRSRIASVDALRGLVITLMIFVNDVAGVDHAPSWLKHVPSTFDGMTLPDLVFPAFLFLAGMSIPLSFSRAIDEGQSRHKLVLKVLGRTVALLVMGVLMVNMEEYNPWFRGAWGILTYVAMFAAFVVIPAKEHPRYRFFAGAHWIGIVLLLALAFAYRTPTGEHLLLGPLFSSRETVWLAHSWWGILGLIGWAYLVASLVYLYFGRRREWLVGATALLMLLSVETSSSYGTRLASRPWLDGVRPLLNVCQTFLGWLNAHVSIGSNLGALAAISTAGCCLGALLTPRSELQSHQERLRWGTGFAFGLFIAALLLDAPYGINKIHATPTWCLLCAGITASAWVFLYWRTDVHQHGALARIVGPAGANPLLAYLLHPLLFMLADLLNVPLGFYRDAQWPVLASLIGCLMMALLVVQLTGLIVRTGYRLKV